MVLLRQIATLVLLFALAACGMQRGASVLPSTHELAPNNDVGTGLPGGDVGTGLPGAQLLCAPPLTGSGASCTIAINLNIPAITLSTTPAALLPGLHPSDLRSMYGLASSNSDGTVAIVDAYDSPLAETDLSVYRLAYGLPACTSSNGCFRKVDQRGGTQYPVANLGWGEEIALDLDMVSAICPKCKILLVEADSASIDDLGAGVDTAAALGAVAISNSYYATEWPDETNEEMHYTHPGIAITVSAGDQTGAYYPAVSPHVTAVGGTSLAGGTETPWSYSGGGCSAYMARPSWQHDTGCSTRAANDVAAVADPQTGVSMYDTLGGGWLVAGGTSVGAPIVAAAYALSGNPQGPEYSYTQASAFHDVAPAGYDLITGLGSPDGVSGL